MYYRGADAAGLPRWSGPPHDVVPGATPAGAVLGQGPGAVVALHPLGCFPTGVSLTLTVMSPDAERDLGVLVTGWDHPRHHPVPGALRLALHLADGPVLTAGDLHDGDQAHALSPRRSQATDTWAEVTFWLAPLPTAGPLRVVCSWPEREVAESVTTLDVDEIRAAAGRAVRLPSS